MAVLARRFWSQATETYYPVGTNSGSMPTAALREATNPELWENGELPEIVDEGDTPVALLAAQYLGVGTDPVDDRRVTVAQSDAGEVVRVTRTSTGDTAAAVRVAVAESTGVCIGASVTSDTSSRFVVRADGTLVWGAGAGTTDTNLYRSTADTLKTDGSLVVASKLAVGTGTTGANIMTVSGNGTVGTASFTASAVGTASTGVVLITTPDTTKRAIDIRVLNDSVARLRIDTGSSSSGTITFGNGTLADTNLYRSAADTLKTDDSFVVGTNLTVTSYTSFGSAESSGTFSLWSPTNALVLGSVGTGMAIKEGVNASMGVATLVAGTVTVVNTKVTASTRIFAFGQNSSGTAGELTVSARTPGTSFTITSSSGADARDVAWLLIEPAA